MKGYNGTFNLGMPDIDLLNQSQLLAATQAMSAANSMAAMSASSMAIAAAEAQVI